MRVVFLGSGPFAVPTLETLWRLSPRYTLAAVITRPDRPARRGRRPLPTPVKERASAMGAVCLTPRSVDDTSFQRELRALETDLCIVADYGEILRPAFLELPPIGVFNLHASLLPKHRGAAPVAYALLAGETVTGVTLFRIVEKLDAGPVVATSALTVEPGETAGELEARLAVLAADLLESCLASFESGSFAETPQDDSQATLAPKLKKEMGRIDWAADPDSLANAVRAFNPWPLAYSFLTREGKGGGRPERTNFLRVELAENGEGKDSEPGTVVAVTKDTFYVACRGGSIRVIQIQREGKSAMESGAYLCGRPLTPGDRFVAGEERLRDAP